jgi:hypothetical protein
MRPLLSQWQQKVLAWIGEGCPDGVMRDLTYKTTAVALQNRHLVTVSKRGGVWRAEITAAGQYYLEHGAYPEPARTPRRAGRGAPGRPFHPERQISTVVTADDRRPIKTRADIFELTTGDGRPGY